MVGDELGHLVRHVQVEKLGLAADDGHPRLKVRRLDVGGEAPLEAGAQTLFQAFYFLRRAVAGQNDLLARAVEGVEGVEELLLGALLAGDELDVVHQQHVRGAVGLAELVGAARLDGGDELVGEGLAVHIHDVELRVVLFDFGGDGGEQVGLAQARLPVDEQRVVSARGIGGHRLGRRVGELVGGAFDEVLEGEVIAAVRLRLGFGGGGGFLLFRRGHHQLHLHVEAQHSRQCFSQKGSVTVPHDGADEVVAHRQRHLAAALEAHRLQPVDVQVVGGVHQALFAVFFCRG